MSFCWETLPRFAPLSSQAEDRQAGCQAHFEVLVEDRFPAVWQPPAENENLRQLLLHRCQMVRTRTRVRNQLDSIHPTDEDLSAGAPAMAKNEGLLSKRVWCPMRRNQIEALPLSGWNVERRKDLMALLEEMSRRIEPLDEAVIEAAEQNAEACLLMTHPGVGPVVSLAYVLTIGNRERFPRGKQVGSYLPPQRRRPVAGVSGSRVGQSV